MSQKKSSSAEIPLPTPEIVGNAFVHQYYIILDQSPDLVHRFYHENSKLGRPERGGAMSTTTTLKAINDKIVSLKRGDNSNVEISTVDSQESHDGGLIVFVTGSCFIGNNKDKLMMRQRFSQTFFLAPQDKDGYFVLNDVFRYVGDAEPVDETKKTDVSDDDDAQDLHSQSVVLEEEVNKEDDQYVFC